MDNKKLNYIYDTLKDRENINKEKKRRSIIAQKVLLVICGFTFLGLAIYFFYSMAELSLYFFNNIKDSDVKLGTASVLILFCGWIVTKILFRQSDSILSSIKEVK